MTSHYTQNVYVPSRKIISVSPAPFDEICVHPRPASVQSGNFCHLQIILNASQFPLSEAPQDSCTPVSCPPFEILQCTAQLVRRTKAKCLLAPFHNPEPDKQHCHTDTWTVHFPRVGWAHLHTTSALLLVSSVHAGVIMEMQCHAFSISLLVMRKVTSKLLTSYNSPSEDRENYRTALGSKNSQEVQSRSCPSSLLTPCTPKGEENR